MIFKDIPMKYIYCIIAFLVLPVSVVRAENLYQPLPGTLYEMVPPQEFSANPQLHGFQNTRTNSSIFMTEIPAPFPVLAQQMSRADVLATRGMALQKTEKIQLQGNTPAVLLEVRQDFQNMKVRKYIVLTGDQQKTVLLNGVYFEQFPQQGHLIKQAMMTFRAQAGTPQQQDVAPKALSAVELPFVIDIKGTKFAYASSMPFTNIYTSTGHFPLQQGEDQAYFMVGTSTQKTTIPEDKKAYTLERIHYLPQGKDLVVDSIEKSIHEGMETYTVMASNTVDKDEKIQLVLFYKNDGYNIFFGSARSDYDANFEQFRKIAASFKNR